MKKLLIILLLFTNTLLCQSSKYSINTTKVLGWTSLSIGGFIDGFVEGYEFDGRTYFEDKFNVSPYSFWGSESWRRAYKGGNPDNGFKSSYRKWRGAFDFYHVGDDSRVVMYVTGGTLIGSNYYKQNIKHFITDCLISFIVVSTSKSIGMRLVRN